MQAYNSARQHQPSSQRLSACHFHEERCLGLWLSQSFCRERAEQKRLKREVQKEHRGAVRELRKDAAFMHAVREGEQRTAQAERRGKLKANMSFMQQQVPAAGCVSVWAAGTCEQA